MKCLLRLALALAALWSGWAGASPLISVDLVSQQQKIHAGEAFYLNVEVSGLRTAGLDAVVGAFDFTLAFDGVHLRPFNVGAPAGWGTALGNPDLGESIAFADFSQPGLLRLAMTSLLDEAGLSSLQSDSIILATLGFMLVSAPPDAVTAFALAQVDLADAFAQPISDDAGDLVPIQLGTRTFAVPAPPTAALVLVACLAGLGVMRRQRSGRGRRPLRDGRPAAPRDACPAMLRNVWPAVVPGALLALTAGLPARAAELPPVKAAQATFAGASAWAVREDRNYAAYAKALALHTLWDGSPALRANPGALAAAVQQKWDEDQSRDDPVGRKLARALQAGAKSLGREGAPLLEKLHEKALVAALPVVDEAVLDKGGRTMKRKQGQVSAVDASLVLEDEFEQLARRSTDRRFVQAYNQTVGAALGVRMGLGEAATRLQRPTYHAALAAHPEVVAMRNAKGGFSIGGAQAVAAIKGKMGGMVQATAAVKAEIRALAPLQANVAGYMGDAALRATQRTRLQQAAQQQQATLDSARAAGQLLAAALGAESPKLAQQVNVLRRSHQRVAESYVGYAKGVADLGKAPNLPPQSARLAATVLSGQLLGAAAEMFSLYAKQQAPDPTLVGHLKSLGREMRDIPVEIEQHHDRMNGLLAGIHRDLGTELQKLELATADIQQKVGEIQNHLYAIEDRISSLERNLTTILQESALQSFLVEQDTALGYKARTNLTLSLTSFDSYQVLFRSWSDQVPCTALFSAPAAGHADDDLYPQLVSSGRRLDENLDFLVKYADARLGRPAAAEGCVGSGRLPNPNVWLLGAGAYLQLARENPWYAARTERNDPQALSSVIATGNAVRQAVQSFASAAATTGRRAIFFQALDAYASAAVQLFDALAQGQPSTLPAQRLSGQQALLKALVATGLPRSLAENDYLDSLLAGEQALPAGEDIVRHAGQGVSLSVLQASTEARRLALHAELTGIFQAMDRADYVEHHSAIQAMLDALDNRRVAAPALAVADFFSARPGSALKVPVGTVLGNDARPFPADTVNNPVKARLWGHPAQGTLTWPASNDGSFTYVAPAGFAGEVSFTYKASDGVFDSLEATVVVRIGDFGDLNSDGAVDTTDVSLLMGLIGTEVDEATLAKADLNADGVVNALDARMLTWLCSKPLCAR